MDFPSDVHTHNLDAKPGSAIVNLPWQKLLDKVEPSFIHPDGLYSAGLHPWYLENAEKQLKGLVEWIKLPQIVAIGECGLDKLCNTNFLLQCNIYEQQLNIAAINHLPIIIHCVKAFDELLAISKSIKANEPRIIHGFRGKPQQATQLLNAGFSLSFGTKYNSESFNLCPLERKYRETDDNYAL